MLLDEMEIFYYVAEYKSFSKAARQLSVSKSFISKKISKLEQALKVHLISRSTRTLSLTEAGENFYRYCEKIVKERDDAFSMLHELKGKPSGVLKLSVPPALGLNLLSSILPGFLQRYPEVSIDIQLENRVVDVLEEGYDLVLRSAASLTSSNLIAQRIFSIKNILCATKKYLQLHGIPSTASDLEKHNVATYRYRDLKNAGHLILTKNTYEYDVAVRGNFMSNHLDLIKQMVLNDVCIAVLPEFMVAHEIDQKKLIPCLTAYQLPENPFYAIYPERKFMLPKLKYFLEELKQYLQE